MKDTNVVETAEIVLAVRDYKTVDTRKKKRLVDFTVSPRKSDDKILVRVIVETQSGSGYVGVDSVRKMSNILEERNYDKGVLVGKQFTEAARNEIEKDKIAMISDIVKPYFKSIKLFSKINEYTQKICKAKCGQVPLTASECRGHTDGHYTCEVRLTSDNADFHFERG